MHFRIKTCVYVSNYVSKCKPSLEILATQTLVTLWILRETNFVVLMRISILVSWGLNVCLQYKQAMELYHFIKMIKKIDAKISYFDIKTFKISTFPGIITNIMHCIKIDYLTRHWFNFVQDIGLRAKYVKGAVDGNLIRIWDVWVFIIQCMSDNIYKFFRRWHSEATSRTTLLSNRKERLIWKEDASIIIFHQHHLTSNVCHYHVPRSMVIRWKVSIYLDVE